MDSPVLCTATAFSTPLGWMAVVVRGSHLRGLSFGHRSRSAALAAVQNRLASAAAGAGRDDVTEELAARLQAYAAGEVVDFRNVEIDSFEQTPFARRVIRHCRRIPYGRTISYAQLADRAGSPGAARAVGNIMAANRCPLVVPCHRVVGSGARLGGYSAAGGLKVKLRLLEMESAATGGELAGESTRALFDAGHYLVRTG